MSTASWDSPLPATWRASGNWHGATPEHFMTHLAMWEAPEGGGQETEWGELVTDEEYSQR